MLIKYIPKIINSIAIISPKTAAKIAIRLFSRPRRYNRTEPEQALFEQGKQVILKSGRAANIWGDETAPLVFLCHGWESRGTTFHILIEQLLAQNLRVMAWNAPAHGASPGKSTNLLLMAAALKHDLIAENIVPDAFVGHSMGGAMVGLLHRSHKLPKSITIISAPTDIKLVFKRYFDLLHLAPKAQDIVLEKFNNFGEFNLHSVSLLNSSLYNDTTPLVVHDEDDKEIPFSEFTNLRDKWPAGEFLPTQGLGHRRILRDEKLATKITSHIMNTI